MMFRFAYPTLIPALGILFVAWLVVSYLRKRPGITYSMTSRLILIAGHAGALRGRLPAILRGIALVLLILAAARPQLYNVSRDIRSPGVDIMLSLDTSGSMAGLDFKLDDEPVTRLDAVKKVVSDFITKRPADRIGLVVFGEDAYTQAPLTMDKGLLLGLVKDMRIGMAGDRTAVGQALAIAGKRLKDLEAKSKILILLTDGRSNTGDITPIQAAEALKALGVKVYAIGVGGKGEAPFLVNTVFGRKIVYQDVDLDEDTLKQIADITGGRYFLASDTNKLSEIYEIIDKAEKTEVKVKEFFHYKELYLYFLVPAFLLIGLEILVRVVFVRVFP